MCVNVVSYHITYFILINIKFVYNFPSSSQKLVMITHKIHIFAVLGKKEWIGRLGSVILEYKW